MKIIRPDGVAVNLGSSHYMLLDNGPFSFGSWMVRKFDADTNITKKFSTGEKSFTLIRMELSTFWPAPGSGEIEVNGIRFPVKSAPLPGIVRVVLDLPFPNDSTFNIKLVSSSVDVFFITDLQRNYGRTQINGKTANGELVCKIFCVPGK